MKRQELEPIVIGNKEFRWTEHAYERAFERLAHPVFMNDVLKQALETMPVLPDKDFVFRDVITQGTFVISKDKAGRNIFWIVTFGWMSKLYPRNGSYTVLRRKDGSYGHNVWDVMEGYVPISENGDAEF